MEPALEFAPSAISSVRGTDFRVGVVEVESASTSEVLTGAVEVEGKGKAIKVPEKYGTFAAAGKSPRPPIKLLSPLIYLRRMIITGNCL